jgi:hypothetical protein
MHMGHQVMYCACRHLASDPYEVSNLHVSNKKVCEPPPTMSRAALAGASSVWNIQRQPWTVWLMTCTLLCSKNVELNIQQDVPYHSPRPDRMDGWKGAFGTHSGAIPMWDRQSHRAPTPGLGRHTSCPVIIQPTPVPPTALCPLPGSLAMCLRTRAYMTASVIWLGWCDLHPATLLPLPPKHLIPTAQSAPLTSYMVARKAHVPSGPNTWMGMSAFS